MTTALIVAGNVRGALAKKGVTQAQAAEILEISRDSFRKRITGKYPFDVAELEKLAEGLGVSYRSLVEVEED